MAGDIGGKVFIDVEARAKGQQDVRAFNDEMERTAQIAADAQRAGAFGDSAREDFKRDLDRIADGFRTLESVISNSQSKLKELANTWKELGSVVDNVGLGGGGGGGLPGGAGPGGPAGPSGGAGPPAGGGGAGGGVGRGTWGSLARLMQMARGAATLGMGFSASSFIYGGITEERELEKWWFRMQMAQGNVVPFGIDAKEDLLSQRRTMAGSLKWGAQFALSPQETQAYMGTVLGAGGTPYANKMFQPGELPEQFGRFALSRGLGAQDILPIVATIMQVMPPGAGNADLAQKIADAIGATGQRGLERDILSVLQGNINMLSAVLPEVTQNQITNMAGVQTLMGSLAQGWRGQGGAGITQRLQQWIQAPGGGEGGMAWMMRSLGLGADKNFAQVRLMMEEGLAGGNLERIMANLGQIGNPIQQAFFLERTAGVSFHDALTILGYDPVAYMKTGDLQKRSRGSLLGGLKEGLPTGRGGPELHKGLGDLSSKYAGAEIYAVEIERALTKIDVGVIASATVTKVNKIVNELVISIVTMFTDGFEKGIKDLVKTMANNPEIAEALSLLGAWKAAEAGVTLLAGDPKGAATKLASAFGMLTVASAAGGAGVGKKVADFFNTRDRTQQFIEDARGSGLSDKELAMLSEAQKSEMYIPTTHKALQFQRLMKSKGLDPNIMEYSRSGFMIEEMEDWTTKDKQLIRDIAAGLGAGANFDSKANQPWVVIHFKNETLLDGYKVEESQKEAKIKLKGGKGSKKAQ